ncbi:MAG: tRNA pseudouridine(38-40) synthase TruA [Acidobacteriota bacterium]
MQENRHTYRLTVAYLGTRFAGWQKQPRQETIQEQLETALSTLLKTPVRVTGAGRTDAGVHARGQVAHFRTVQKVKVQQLHPSLNALLPGDICVSRLGRAPSTFHARHDARQKLYQYLLHVGDKPSPFQAATVARMSGAVPDLARMREAASFLVGRHDFSAFCGAGSAVRSHWRSLHVLEIRRRGPLISFQMAGDGFLRHQVRNVVGTLVQVGRGQRTVASVSSLLANGDRRQAGPTAPAVGLCLMSVQYSRRRQYPSLEKEK